MYNVTNIEDSFEVRKGNTLIYSNKRDSSFIYMGNSKGNPSNTILTIFSNSDSISLNLFDLNYSDIKEAMLDVSSKIFKSFDSSLWGNEKVETVSNYIILNHDRLTYPVLIGMKNHFIIEHSSDSSNHFRLKSSYNNFSIRVDYGDLEEIKSKMYSPSNILSSDKFEIFDTEDPTKKVVFDLSDMPTGTTRKLIPPNNDGQLVAYETGGDSPVFIETPNERSYGLNGIDEYLTINSDLTSYLDKDTEFSLSFWCRVFPNHTENADVFFYLNNNYFRIYASIDNKLITRYGNSANLILTYGNNTKWFLYTFVNSSNSRDLYYNGLKIQSSTNNWGPENLPENLIVGFNENNKYAKMQLDDLCIWDKALTQSDVSDLWNGGIYKSPNTSSSFSQNCKAWFNADSECLPQNQPISFNIINNVDNSFGGIFNGIKANKISKNYPNSTP